MGPNIKFDIYWCTLGIVLLYLPGSYASRGREFYIAYWESDPEYTNLQVRDELMISAYEDTTVNVENPSGIVNLTLELESLQTHRILLPVGLRIQNQQENWKGIKVTATGDISAQGSTSTEVRSQNLNTMGGYLVLSTGSNNLEYIIAACRLYGSPRSSLITVVSGRDQTQCNLFSPTTLTLIDAFTLSAMESKAFFSNDYSGVDDWSGASLECNKPVSAYGGADRGVIDENTDYTITALPPTSDFGTMYIIPPIAGRASNSSMIRIFPAEDNTLILWYGPGGGFENRQVDRGAFWQKAVDGTSRVECDKPCMVVQYNYGQSFDNTPGTGVFIVNIPHLDQYSNDLRFATARRFDNGTFNNFLSIVSKSNAIPYLGLNETPLDNLNWMAVDDWDEYVTVSLPIEDGSYRLHAEGIPQPTDFTAWVHGHGYSPYGSFTGYGYSCGM